MAFTKIKETDKTGKKITELSDTPQISAEEAKARFDALPELAIQFLNNLIDDLGKNTSAESLGAKSPDGIPSASNTVQAVIDAVAKLITDNKGSYDSVVKILNGISEISNTVKNSSSSLPTGKAIVSYVTELGGGDMQRLVYDADNDGVVDDAAKLGGSLPSVFQKVNDSTINTTEKTIPGAINELFVMAQNGGKNLVGDEFSIDKAYAVGDYCIYENVLYKFTSEKQSGAWDESKVTLTTCADEFKALNSNIEWYIEHRVLPGKGSIFFLGIQLVTLVFGTFAISGNYIVLSQKAKGTYYFHTTVPVDVTNYTKLEFVIKKHAQNNVESVPTIFGLSTSPVTTLDVSQFVVSISLEKTDEISDETVKEIDISSLSGDYYIGLVNRLNYGSSGSTEIEISEVTLY